MRGFVRIVVLAGCAGAATRPFTPSDLSRWHESSDPRITADGAQVVYVENAQLWVVSTDGKTRRSVGAGRLPRWSPDGTRVAFVSGGQIFVDQRRLTRMDSTP